MRKIIDKYIKLLIDNEREFSLEDFIEIFKVSLCAREIDNCQNERINFPLHSCFLCSNQVIEDISPYLCNHTLTLFKVLYVLSNFADIRSLILKLFYNLLKEKKNIMNNFSKDPLASDQYFDFSSLINTAMSIERENNALMDMRQELILQHRKLFF
jgi:hypothetical protein